MTGEATILSGEGLHKSFGDGPARVQVLRGLDLRVARGEFLAVMGPSGCGKSTLLHLLGLMLAPDAGTVHIDGTDVSHVSEAQRAILRRRRIGFVFQRFNLLPVLSGRDNVRLAMKIRGLPDGGRTDRLLAAMGVSDVAARKPGRLSVGQQQRLAVARAMAGEPGLLLADEPTGSLDSDNAAALLDLLKAANRDFGQTIVMITHAPSVAEVADRVVYMNDGRILDGHPEAPRR